jgi:hypothetical protein
MLAAILAGGVGLLWLIFASPTGSEGRDATAGGHPAPSPTSA